MGKMDEGWNNQKVGGDRRNMEEGQKHSRDGYTANSLRNRGKYEGKWNKFGMLYKPRFERS
jgi:hypothetical protein